METRFLEVNKENDVLRREVQSLKRKQQILEEQFLTGKERIKRAGMKRR